MRRQTSSDSSTAKNLAGSTATAPSTWPWLVHISSADGLCAGSLLAKDWVLTAAHCV